ncbi:glutamyl-tRNA reductase [Echinimonas agarilytica]|uniref:Glutamyl-tRNA reductase n=1 Tax=Echinimonas agarilytica TaxID=1215918 RepID=A0AA41W5U6_9GAMM|nr:glutamyl-tRNA reductase [Echinimonas agarilytica]MCM2679187.1 glutamyl-tRNA reductase [Echinimonas agarilytica]
MALIALGINHQTAPVSLRERVAFDPDCLPDALKQLQMRQGCQGAVILSTCNRTELYVEDEGSPEQLLDWLVAFHQVDRTELEQHVYALKKTEAISHLMCVSAGLDSLILGEPQILGQVKQAYAQAKSLDTVSYLLERLFDRAFTVAKQVRTQTDIGASAVSVAYAAVNLAKHIFGQLDKAKVLLVGAGETIELVGKHLQDQGVTESVVSNRTLARASALADQFNGRAVTLHQLGDELNKADIVISSTASPMPIVGVGAVSTALKARRRQPMLLVDLAVPRDIEPEVGDLRDAYLYTVDDLQNIIADNMSSREAAAKEANAMVQEHAKLFMQWVRAQKSVSAIKQYRQQGEMNRDELVNKALLSLDNGQPADQVVRELAYKLTNTLMHPTTKALQQAGTEQQSQRLAHLADSLGLALKKDEH